MCLCVMGQEILSSSRPCAAVLFHAVQQLFRDEQPNQSCPFHTIPSKSILQNRSCVNN